MQSLRRKLKMTVVTVMMVNLIFIVVEVSRSGGPEKPGQKKVLTPAGSFWSRDGPSAAFWNRQQRRLDSLHNPLLNLSNSSSASEPLPDWLNRTQLLPDPCAPDPEVSALVKDFNSLPERFRDFLSYMSCRSYPLVRDAPLLCRDTPFLLLAVKSLTPHFDRRQAIRETWGRAGRVANLTVATVFLLGNTTVTDYFPDLSEMLSYEGRHHGDLLQWDYRDTFFNLTVKEVLFLEWVSARCPHASFIFKGDDDVFVNTPRILELLQDLQPARASELFIGDVITNAGPHRDKKVKYFIPESVFVGAYPAYAGGGGYLYSGELAVRLHTACQQVALYPIDDVYTGMCLRKLGLAPEKHSGFRTFDIEEKYRRNPCIYQSLLLVHPRSPQEILQIWAWLNDPALSCQ